MNRAPSFLLYINVLVVATCGLIYELLAGTLAKAIFTMQPSNGIYLINQMPEVEGLLVDAGGRIWQSDSLMSWKAN